MDTIAQTVLENFFLSSDIQWTKFVIENFFLSSDIQWTKFVIELFYVTLQCSLITADHL